MPRGAVPLLVAVAALIVVGARVEAQGKGLPKCEGRKPLLVGANGQYECAGLEDLLRSMDCSGVLKFTPGDGLKCLKAPSAFSGAELLLPECSSNTLLVSDGWGRWKCVERRELLPDCSSGEQLVSEGSGRWRCAPGLPQCSSGEELESEGGNRWRCRRRN